MILADTSAWCSRVRVTIDGRTTPATAVALPHVALRRRRRLDAAVRIYRRCRRIEVTPRGMIDCMIAAVARRSGATVLAWDADLDRVARVVGIDLEDAALRA